MDVWYLPTRRNNVVGMFTTGLLLPAEGLDKYEPDPQEQAIGRLLISRSEVPADWWGGDGGRDDQRVILELSLPPDAVQEVMPGHPGISSVAGVLPANLVRAVHVPSDGARQEFLARRYDNFDPGGLTVHVSLDLFGASGPGQREVKVWLDSGRGAASPIEVALGPARRLAGAIVMVASGCPMMQGEDPGVRTRILTALAQRRDGPVGAPETVHTALTEAGWLSEDARRADQVLLSHIIRTVIDLDPKEPFGPRRLLEAIRVKAEGDPSSDATVARNLERVGAIVRNDADLRPLSPASGLRAAKSLLLFLLRPGPRDVIGWAEDMPSDPLSIVGAALLSGLASDVRALPSEFRRPDVWHRVQDLEASLINDNRSEPWSRRPVFDVESGAGGQRIVITG